MPRNLTASDRKNLIRLAASLPKGSSERRAILAGIAKTGFRWVSLKEAEAEYPQIVASIERALKEFGFRVSRGPRIGDASFPFFVSLVSEKDRFLTVDIYQEKNGGVFGIAGSRKKDLRDYSDFRKFLEGAREDRREVERDNAFSAKNLPAPLSMEKKFDLLQREDRGRWERVLRGVDPGKLNRYIREFEKKPSPTGNPFFFAAVEPGGTYGRSPTWERYDSGGREWLLRRPGKAIR